MLFKISVFGIINGSKKWVYSKEMRADNAIQAFEKARIRISPDRIIEIRQIDLFQRPQFQFKLMRMMRIKRNGVI